jgi:hypothetical protein
MDKTVVKWFEMDWNGKVKWRCRADGHCWSPDARQMLLLLLWWWC